MKKSLGRFTLVLVASLTAVVLAGSVAGASVSIPENPVPLSTGQNQVDVTVSYSGFTPASAVYINQCKKNPADPTFNYSFDCSNQTGIQINPAANPTGSGSKVYKLFRGDEPTGDKSWGCYAPGDPSPEGYERFETCWIRVTQDTFLNNAQAQGFEFSFVVQGAPIPEAPMAILLPVVAGSVLAAAFLISRRRSTPVGIA